MTRDEFINFDMGDCKVRLTGDLACVEGNFLLVKYSGDEDGALARGEDFNDFIPGYGHAYADGPIFRYHQVVGDISMIERVLDTPNY